MSKRNKKDEFGVLPGFKTTVSSVAARPVIAQIVAAAKPVQSIGRITAPATAAAVKPTIVVIPASTAKPVVKSIGRLPQQSSTVMDTSSRGPTITAANQAATMVTSTLPSLQLNKSIEATPVIVPSTASNNGTGQVWNPPGDVPTGPLQTEQSNQPQPEVMQNEPSVQDTSSSSSVPNSSSTDSSSNSTSNQSIQSTALVVQPTKSVWQRILDFLGFGKKAESAVTVHGETSLRGMTESLVRRARNGDQNAMALIALIRDNARKGHPQAQVSYALLHEYIKTNPVGDKPSFGEDSRVVEWQIGTEKVKDRIYSDAVTLSHGPKLLNPRIEQFLSHFSGEEQSAISYGMNNKEAVTVRPKHPKLERAVRMGQILGHARKLQAVRQPNSSISKFDPIVGWELGEC